MQDDAAGVEKNVGRLIETGAVSLNIEDSLDGGVMRPLDESAGTGGRRPLCGGAARVLMVINARVDALSRGETQAQAIERANAYLGAGASVVFMLGLDSEELVRSAVDAVDGRISVMASPGTLSLATFARLGVSRIELRPVRPIDRDGTPARGGGQLHRPRRLSAGARLPGLGLPGVRDESLEQRGERRALLGREAGEGVLHCGAPRLSEPVEEGTARGRQLNQDAAGIRRIRVPFDQSAHHGVSDQPARPGLIHADRIG